MFKTESEIITEGLRRSFQTANCKMANRTCYGYTTTADGELIVNENEAIIVKWIFERYLAGDSFGKIATALEKQGILSPICKVKWNHEAISSYCATRNILALCCFKRQCAMVVYN